LFLVLAPAAGCGGRATPWSTAGDAGVDAAADANGPPPDAASDTHVPPADANGPPPDAASDAYVPPADAVIDGPTDTSTHATDAIADAAQLTCFPPWADCDGLSADGCETSLTTDDHNCGDCGNACVNLNGTTGCAAGICIPSCDPGFADCDGNPANGCETNTNVDMLNCGGCGVECVCPGGTVPCVGGRCAAGCDPGFGDCDGDWCNGCEANLVTDPHHCGGCSIVCGTDQICAQGACQ
jgi:hypothetical protein